MKPPIIQIALDFTETSKAVEIAREAVGAGADWIEAGYPLVTTQRVAAIGEITQALRETYTIVDFMILVGARRFIDAAKTHGAQGVTVSALAPDVTVRDCIKEGRRQGIHITVDLFHTRDPAGKAKRYEAMGADYVMVHLGADEKREDPGRSALRDLDAVLQKVDIPVSFAAYTLEEAVTATRMGASVIAHGEPMISAANPYRELARFVERVKAAV